MNLRLRWGSVACCALLLLAACGKSVPATEVANAPASTVTPTYSADKIIAALKKEWRDWRPSQPIKRPHVTPEEAERMRIENAERNRPESLPSSVPVPDLVRWDSDEQGVLNCVKEHGFPAERAAISGGIGVNGLPESQKEQFNRVTWECWAQYPPPPELSLPWSREQYAALLEYYSTFYIHCQTELGYRYIGPEPPSLDSWIADMESGKVAWDSMWPEYWQRDPSRPLLVSGESISSICGFVPSEAAMLGE